MTKKKPSADKSPGGRPTDYRPEYAEKTRVLCEHGATDIELADFFQVSLRTIQNWRHVHPKFLLASKVGKEVADDRVERSLYHRAVGYTFEAVKIFMPAGASEPVYAPYREHIPPETTAALTWLKNRRGADWRDRQEIDHSGKIEVDESPSEARRKAALALLLARQG